MLKGRGVGDTSLMCIYSDTRAGLRSLHDDSKEGMRPGENAGSQRDGGSPQVQNPATLGKKEKTLPHEARLCLPPRLVTAHIPNVQGAIVFQPLIYSSWESCCLELDVKKMQLLFLLSPHKSPLAFWKHLSPNPIPLQDPHQMLIFLFPFFCAPKYSSSETLDRFASFIKNVKFCVVGDVTFDNNSAGWFQSKRFLGHEKGKKEQKDTDLVLNSEQAPCAEGKAHLLHYSVWRVTRTQICICLSHRGALEPTPQLSRSQFSSQQNGKITDFQLQPISQIFATQKGLYHYKAHKWFCYGLQHPK